MTDAAGGIEYRDHYFDDPLALASFERCAKSVFGLDFGKWKARGLWDDRYQAFSAFVEGECVASLCVYPLEMTIDNKKRTGAQLLTVGTINAYRSRGIQRALWSRAEAWIRTECDFAFLFTDESAAGFYEKIGLRRRREFSQIVPFRPPRDRAPARFTKLDIDRDSHFAIVERLARERTPVSRRIGYYNPNLLLFMFLYVYGDLTFFIEEFDAVVVAEKSGGSLRIHDIVAAAMPRVADLERFFARFDVTEIEFLFCTDRLDLGVSSTREVKDDVLFVSDDFELDGEFVFPYSIRG